MSSMDYHLAMNPQRVVRRMLAMNPHGHVLTRDLGQLRVARFLNFRNAPRSPRQQGVPSLVC